MTDHVDTLLADIQALFASEPQLKAALAAAQPNTTRTITPVPSAARRVVAAIATRQHRSSLLIAATPDAAVRMHADLTAWLGENVMLFPPTDTLPYEHMSADIGIVAQRLAVLGRLHASEPICVVASVKALMQPTMTPEEFQFATRLLRQGDQHDPRKLLAHWVSLGYRVGPTAEQPGDLSQRGGIIDIFPPTSDRPIRLEFWDDQLESLRIYDPISQRSDKRVRQIQISPAHEIPFWRRTEAIKRIEQLQIASLRREVQHEWATAREHLETGQRFEGRAFYAPFFRTPHEAAEAGLWQHLPASAIILLSEEHELNAQGIELQSHADLVRSTQIENNELPPDFPFPLIAWTFIRRSIQRWSCLNLSNQPIADDQNDSFVHEINTFSQAASYGGQTDRLFEDLRERLVGGERVVLISPQASRLRELASQHNLALIGEEDGPDVDDPPFQSGTIIIRHGNLSGGFSSDPLRLTILSDSEIFGWQQRRALSTRARKQRTESDRTAFLQSLKVGDYVVHIEHGIAQYEGLSRIEASGAEREFLVLRYASGDKLYVPVDQVDRVSRYIGAGEGKPTLTRLGTSDWERAKRKVRADVEELATELLDLYAARQLVEGFAYSSDTSWQRELEDSFPYTETDDQLRAIEEVKSDMENTRPMDRLICGDVGFGKTEVALRAAFKAVQDGRQVAVLVPTTVLAQQHFETFSRRMQMFPVRIEMLSRFRSASQQKSITERIVKGEIDIVVGTHRILSSDIHFKQLGLVIIDEEQRFGVKDKERLKKLRHEIDVLTLTATPIPRTMHMALSGIRDLSVIDTPPDDRMPIKTYVQPYNEMLVRDAILRELGRNGQAYFVHNRVQSIYTVANRLQKLVPEARIGVGHGQMPEKALEKVILQFFEGLFDVFVCTTIIESGIDVPSANTMIIDDATTYGLAQLYQLRGRVGRSTQRGYAYMFYNPTKAMGEEAQKRLEAIQEATELGAGFRIAMRDLEIRGTGNLLGAEQSGNITTIGFDLYSRLLSQAVERVREERKRGQQQKSGEQKAQRARAVEALRRAAVVSARSSFSGDADDPVLPDAMVSIDLPINAYLPQNYVDDEPLRLRVYQHIAEARSTRDIRMLRQELEDRFGPVPEPAARLLDLLTIKVLALQAGVISIISDDNEITVRLPKSVYLDREQLQRESPRGVVIGPQLARLDRRVLRDDWEVVLRQLLEALNKIGN
ncbi:MAG TPA: transcription-repair coupling factor [Herpetosiphon sp.]|uniref:Transcription-repair-coupling factor n=1 Tax=Herpetosiphon aurantiacus (strain ATCC 23779 / DSM 785 / 114-95) TaxID=316274 RepID=A9B116_HERA2|nr:transcription-repair coupling factor [Herpetosiphon sp.]ABX05294.1 transcription-repair coupling factor [Herpetosiphon aurantiacus DSM 785]HBW51197.1 transcription-repair coupling factor [Herpetosiphon sp.]